MPHIQINDTQYYYELHGQGDPIVLIAGYSCDHSFWDLIFDELIENFQVLAFDNRGVGQTRDKQTALTLEEMADETHLLIQKIGLSRPTIIGQSMGGIIAQLIAKKYPDTLENLILLNSSAKINVRTIMALESFVKLLKEESPIDTVIEASLPWFFSPRFLASAKNVARAKQNIMTNPFPQTLDDLVRQMSALKTFDASKYPERILTRTLVIAAKDDIVCLPEESEPLAKNIHGAKLVMISGGHSSPVESPQEVVKAITEFVSKKQKNQKIPG